MNTSDVPEVRLRPDAERVHAPLPETTTTDVNVAMPAAALTIGEDTMQEPEAIARVTEFVTDVSVARFG